MRIYQLLNIKNADQIKDPLQAIAIVESTMKHILGLSEQDSSQSIIDKYIELNQTPPFDQIFQAYIEFCSKIHEQQSAAASTEGRQPVQQVKVRRKVKEYHPDKITDACSHNNYPLFKQLLADSPSYKFDGFVSTDFKSTTCLREAIRHNNSAMVDDIVMHDGAAITDVYRTQKYKMEMSFLPELFLCHETTFNSFLKHLHLINKLKKNSTSAMKENILKEALRRILDMKSEEREDGISRFKTIFNALYISDLKQFDVEVFNVLKKFKAKHESIFTQSILPMFNPEAIEEIKKQLQISTQTPAIFNLPTPSVVEFNPQLLGENHYSYWNSKRVNVDREQQDLSFVFVEDSPTQQPAKKARTNIENQNNNNNQDIIVIDDNSLSTESNSNLVGNFIVIDDESELLKPKPQSARTDFWKPRQTIRNEQQAIMQMKKIPPVSVNTNTGTFQVINDESDLSALSAQSSEITLEQTQVPDFNNFWQELTPEEQQEQLEMLSLILGPQQ